MIYQLTGTSQIEELRPGSFVLVEEATPRRGQRILCRDSEGRLHAKIFGRTLLAISDDGGSYVDFDEDGEILGVIRSTTK